MNDIKYEATIACSKCVHSNKETMSDDKFLVFYECKNCGYVITPKENDLCVFCSYSDQLCPVMQQANISQQKRSEQKDNISINCQINKI